jgi:serine/threonine protein kinase
MRQRDGDRYCERPTEPMPLPSGAGDLGIEGLTEPAEIGRGGFAVVYKAKQAVLGRLVAVKVLSATIDGPGRERFAREGFALGGLSAHPNIVNVFGTGVTAYGRPYITMDYLPEGCLGRQVTARGPMFWPRAVGIAAKIAGALETAHRVGTLHRDVKPENVLLSDYGEPQLADFGIARVQGRYETPVGPTSGSFLYTAPEVFEGAPPQGSADVYSLAATLFYLLAGAPPFPAAPGESFAALFLRIATQPAPELPCAVPGGLRTLLAQALRKDPATRPPSALEFGLRLIRVEQAAGLAPTTICLPSRRVAAVASR